VNEFVEENLEIVYVNARSLSDVVYHSENAFAREKLLSDALPCHQVDSLFAFRAYIVLILSQPYIYIVIQCL
jgi:hypothetical protein